MEIKQDLIQIPFHRPYMTEDEVNAACEAIRNGWLTMGLKTIEFENKFRDYLGVKEAVAVNSGTAALHLAFKCLEPDQGDEVIMPAMTFTSTAEVVRYFNAVPVFADIDKETHLIDINDIEHRITKKTRAIIPVHFSGQPADMKEIMDIAKRHHLFVIEDAAHSFPALYMDKNIGTIGDFTCFSFYATKTLCTGEGGMVTTENPEWAENIRMLRLHGISKDAWKRYTNEGSWEYDVFEAGYKYNPTDITSAIGLEQLKKIDIMNSMRAGVADKYNRAFSNEEGIILYKIKGDRTTSWHLYPLKLNINILKISRDEFIEEMKKRGISVSVHFIPLYRFSYYKKMGFNAADYPESEWVFNRTVSLPIYPGMSEKETDYVIDNVLDIIRKNRR